MDRAVSAVLAEAAVEWAAVVAAEIEMEVALVVAAAVVAVEWAVLEAAAVELRLAVLPTVSNQTLSDEYIHIHQKSKIFDSLNFVCYFLQVQAAMVTGDVASRRAET